MEQVGVSAHLCSTGLIGSWNNRQQLSVDGVLAIHPHRNVLSLNQESTAPRHANVEPLRTQTCHSPSQGWYKVMVWKKKKGTHEGPVEHMCVNKMTAAQSVDWWFGLLGPSSTQETACQVSLITPSCKELTHTSSFSQGKTTFNKCEITSIELQVWNWGDSHSFLPLTSIVRKRKIHTTLKHLLCNDLTVTHPASF